MVIVAMMDILAIMTILAIVMAILAIMANMMAIIMAGTRNPMAVNINGHCDCHNCHNGHIF